MTIAIIRMKPPKAGKILALKFVINYIVNIEKTEEKFIYGMNCNPQTAYEEMLLTKHNWHKTDGRQYCHFIQSFNPKDKVEPQLAHEIGQRLVQEFSQFNGFEIVMVTHTNRNHVHNHFAFNSVNAETGLKWEQKAHDLYLLKEYSNKLCREHSLSEIALGTNKNNQSYGEWVHRKNNDSWKKQLEDDIRTCLGFCTNKPQFFHAMNDKGYDVTWTKTRAAVTFELPNGKKCRNTKLSDTKYFSKENMQAILDNNKENMDLIAEIPDLFLDSLRAAGAILNPSNPDYLMFKDLDKDLSNLEGKELLIAIERLKVDYALEVARIRSEKAKESQSGALSQILRATDDFMQWYQDEDDDLEI